MRREARSYQCKALNKLNNWYFYMNESKTNRVECGQNEESEDKKKEIYVDPRHTEHSFDLPFWRDNSKLWALEVPVEEMSIDELRWIMDVPFWEDEDGNIVITPNEVIQNLDKYPDHRDRIQNSDPSFPLDIMKNKKGEWLTLDGLHRLVKEMLDGKIVVRVRKVPPELVHLTARDE